jgi:voltage-gated potassium channel
MSLVTASIAAFFIGKEEKLLRREMHQEIKILRQEMVELREMMAQLTRKCGRYDPDSESNSKNNGA